MSVVLEEVVVADEPATWKALGFEVRDGVVWLGGVAVRLAGRGAGEGIVGWRLGGLPAGELDGLPAATGAAAPTPPQEVSHPNGAIALDCVVVFTDDFDRTHANLAGAGLEPRRIREVPGGELRQAFYVIGPAVLELVGSDPARTGAEFWGLVVVVADLDGWVARMGDLVGAARDAVQPGRRIATLRTAAGAGAAIAFMSPR